MIAPKTLFEPLSQEPLPGSRRVYVPGQIHPALRVPFREIQLQATRTVNGRLENNAPVRVYDCSGPWGDPDSQIDVTSGLPALRRPWITARGDVEECLSSTGPSASRAPVRARQGKIVTQLHYAREGIITPEMEFIAIRENLGRAQIA